MELIGSLPHYKFPLTVHVLSQINPVHAPHPISWRSVLILSSYLCLGLLSSSFPQVSSPNPLHAPLLSPMCATCPTHLILLNLITWIIFGEEYRLLTYSLCSFLHSPVTSFLLGSDILLSTLFSNTLSLRSPLNVSDHNSHPYKTTGPIMVLYVLIFILLDNKLEDKIFCAECKQTFCDFPLLLLSSSVIPNIIKCLFKWVRRVGKSAFQLRHVGPSVRLPARISVAPTAPTSDIFDTADFYGNLSINPTFCKNRAKLSGTLQETAV